MKRAFLTVFLIISTGLVGLGQTGVLTGTQVKRAKYDLRETGWTIRPETGLWFDYLQPKYFNSHYYDGQMCLHIGCTAGYQFTPHIYLGTGIESVIGTRKYYHSYGYYSMLNGEYVAEESVYGRDVAASLYANLRWYWFDERNSPFLELNAGMFSAFDEYHKPGCLLSPAIGWNFKNYNISICVPSIIYNRKFLTGSYVVDENGDIIEEDWDWKWLREYALCVCFTFGYNFTIKK